MASYRIAVLPGDGIGPEVTAAALPVVEQAAADHGIALAWTSHAAGASHFRETGVALPQTVLEDCLAADAVLLAAIGLPDVRSADGTEVQPTMMMGLRRALDVYAAIRPIRRYPGVPVPLASSRPIDLVILRENLEGLFASFGGGTLLNDEVATDTIVITRRGTERVVRYAFDLARRRRGRPSDGRRLVTCVDKANVFRSFAFFRKVFFEIAAAQADIAAEAQYVDAASMYLLQRPEAYDVLVMENQFGDILSDLGAGLVGGLGMAPSAELGDRHGLFQPSHGTAPDIAGRGIANPLAMILSSAMMLDWLGQRHSDRRCVQAAERIDAAVARVLVEGRALPRDLGGNASTADVGRAVQMELKTST
jgi:3-isopropylmalate dehydrogenase